MVIVVPRPTTVFVESVSAIGVDLVSSTLVETRIVSPNALLSDGRGTVSARAEFGAVDVLVSTTSVVQVEMVEN